MQQSLKGSIFPTWHDFRLHKYVRFFPFFSYFFSLKAFMSITRTAVTTLFAAAALSSTAVMAQTAAAPAAAAPAPAYELAYNVGVVSDYRYRGISQTRLQPAVQGGADLTVGAWYAGAWASNIKWVKDAGGNAQVELDLYGGYKYAVVTDVTIDVGALTYIYPSNRLSPSANTTELYIGVASGPFSAKYSRALTNTFAFADSKGSAYLEANVDYELVKGTNLIAHIGHQTYKNNSAFNYTDLKLGASYEALGGKFAASVVTTDATKSLYTYRGKVTSKAGVVLGYTKTF
jgi:uncharacterized protein (TIGR02001 family)